MNDLYHKDTKYPKNIRVGLGALCVLVVNAL
jgi:hypothetical protein